MEALTPFIMYYTIKSNNMDDRFYAILLCAHRLYELRRGKQLKKRKEKKRNISELIQFRAPKIL